MAKPVSIKKIHYAIIAVILAVVIGYTWLWHAGARGIENGVSEWVTAQRANGLAVEHGRIKSSGYPFFLRTEIKNVSIAAPDEWNWKSETFFIDVLPYDFSRIIFSPQGKQELHLPKAESGLQVIKGEAGKIRASLGRDKERPWYFVLDIDAAKLFTEQSQGDFSLERLLLNIAPASQDSTRIAMGLEVNDAKIKMFHDNQLRQMVLDRIDVASVLSDVHQLTNKNPDQYSAVQNWSQKGGVFDLEYFSIQRDVAKFNASGSLNIDSENYLAGTIDTILEKPAPFVAEIKSSGLVPAEQLDAMNGALAVATLSGGGLIKTKFTMEKGTLKANGAELTRLPKIQ